MPVDNTDDEAILTIAPIETPKPSSKTAASNSSFSRYTPITASTYKLYPSAALPADLTSSYKI